jgi:hypothetical protein
MVLEREFVIMPEFEKQWQAAGLNDDNLKELQSYLCLHPKAGPVIPDTGGLRKLRWSIDKGKQGGMRTIYVDFTRFDTIYLITAYTKSNKVNLTPSEKHKIKDFLVILENNLERMHKHESS